MGLQQNNKQTHQNEIKNMRSHFRRFLRMSEGLGSARASARARAERQHKCVSRQTQT